MVGTFEEVSLEPPLIPRSDQNDRGLSGRPGFAAAAVTGPGFDSGIYVDADTAPGIFAVGGGYGQQILKASKTRDPDKQFECCGHDQYSLASMIVSTRVVNAGSAGSSEPHFSSLS